MGRRGEDSALPSLCVSLSLTHTHTRARARAHAHAYAHTHARTLQAVRNKSEYSTSAAKPTAITIIFGKMAYRFSLFV